MHLDSRFSVHQKWEKGAEQKTTKATTQSWKESAWLWILASEVGVEQI